MCPIFVNYLQSFDTRDEKKFNSNLIKFSNPEEQFYGISSFLEKCLRINRCFDPSSLQFLKYFDYIDNNNPSVIHKGITFMHFDIQFNKSN